MKRRALCLTIATLIAAGATIARAQDPDSPREDVEGRD